MVSAKQLREKEIRAGKAAILSLRIPFDSDEKLQTAGGRVQAEQRVAKAALRTLAMPYDSDVPVPSAEARGKAEKAAAETALLSLRMPFDSASPVHTSGGRREAEQAAAKAALNSLRAPFDSAQVLSADAARSYAELRAAKVALLSLLIPFDSAELATMADSRRQAELRVAQVAVLSLRLRFDCAELATTDSARCQAELRAANAALLSLRLHCDSSDLGSTDAARCKAEHAAAEMALLSLRLPFDAAVLGVSGSARRELERRAAELANLSLRLALDSADSGLTVSGRRQAEVVAAEAALLSLRIAFDEAEARSTENARRKAEQLAALEALLSLGAPFDGLPELSETKLRRMAQQAEKFKDAREAASSSNRKLRLLPNILRCAGMNESDCGKLLHVASTRATAALGLKKKDTHAYIGYTAAEHPLDRALGRYYSGAREFRGDYRHHDTGLDERVKPDGSNASDYATPRVLDFDTYGPTILALLCFNTVFDADGIPEYDWGGKYNVLLNTQVLKHVEGMLAKLKNADDFARGPGFKSQLEGGGEGTSVIRHAGALSYAASLQYSSIDLALEPHRADEKALLLDQILAVPSKESIYLSFSRGGAARPAGDLTPAWLFETHVYAMKPELDPATEEVIGFTPVLWQILSGDEIGPGGLGRDIFGPATLEADTLAALAACSADSAAAMDY